MLEAHTEKRVPRTLFERYARQWMSIVLLATDLFCMFTAAWLAVQLHRLRGFSLVPAYDQIFTLLAITMVIKFHRTGLYPGVGLHYITELDKLVISISTAFLIVVAFTFLMQTSQIYSRLVMLLCWLLSLALIPLGRYLVRRFLIHLGCWGVPVVVIGSPEKARELAKQLHINLHHGLRPDLIIRDEYCAMDGDVNYPVYSLEMIRDSARRLHIQNVLVMVEDLNNIDAVIDRYRFIFHSVILIKDQTGKYGLNDLHALDLANSLGLEVKNRLLNKRTQALKRVIDVLASFFGLLLLSPFLGLAALLIKLDSRGGVFYRQVRLGHKGQVFNLLKFRTMRIDADEVLKMELARDPRLKEEWDRYQKLQNDPRITRFGSLLRKFSLDELPQLWNIVRGEMSMVGPRPITLDQRDLYGSVYYKDYIQMTPGITGLWQVSGRNQTSFVRRAELDIEYIQRWSIWMDIYIIFKTVKVVLLREGAY